MNSDDDSPDNASHPNEPHETTNLAASSHTIDYAVSAVDGASELRLLSRSPHPYHHKNSELLHAFASLSPTRTLRPRPRPHTHAEHPHPLSRPSPVARTSATSLTSSLSAVSLVSITAPFSKDSSPVSDSGTEADDEHFLKGLPAPRAKLHKGLRGMNEVLSGVSTPLLSPELRAHGARPGGHGGRGGRDGTGEDTDGAASVAGSSAVGDGDDTGSVSGRRRRSSTALSPQRLFWKLKRDAAFLDKHDRDKRHGKGSADRSRRRREVVRRSTEVLLLVSLSGLLFSNPHARPLILLLRRELQAVSAVVVGLLALYPLRLILSIYREQRRQTQSQQQERQSGHNDHRPIPSLLKRVGIPVSFDPAPILYPLAIPIFVSLLLATPTLQAAPLMNLILSICTLPKQLIPLSQSVEMYAPVQWALSCVPMIVAERNASTFHSKTTVFSYSSSPSPPASSTSSASPFAELTPETATLLYPLHQTTCWLLQDLTTTSLLPAELQLLSVSLINVLLLAASPQALILKALLWGGGLGILITCGMVIRWGITLARVPRWRFRREADASSTVTSVSAVLRRIWAEIKSPRRARLEMMFGSGDRKRGWDSDDSATYSQEQQQNMQHVDDRALSTESDSDTKPRRKVKLRRPSHRPQKEAQATTAANFEHVLSPEPLEAQEFPKDRISPVNNNDGVQEFPRLPSPVADDTFLQWTPGQKQDTISSFDFERPSPAGFSTLPSRIKKTHTPSGRPKRSASSSVRAFFSLTYEQAARRKWMYAIYLYACILTIILGPIRHYVGTYALHGHEPVGWALGYLFGDVQWFRLEVVKANLEYWVCLPPRAAASLFSSTGSAGDGDATAYYANLLCLSCQSGWVEHVRQAWLGAAGTRLFLVAYWAVILVFGLAVVFTLSPVYEVDTRRKVFHFMMVAMLLPATFIDPAYAALALALVLAVFLLLDLLRASQLPPLSRPIATFLTPYVDGRDLRGPVVISHIFLLIGCAIPLWLSLAALPRKADDAYIDADTAIGTSSSSGNTPSCSAGWELPTRDVSMVAGVVCVGLGDAAASLIGRRWGRRKWLWGGGKSLEGSVAFATAVFAGLLAASLWLRVGGWPVTGEAAATGGGGGGAAAGPDERASIGTSLARAWAWIWGQSLRAVPRAGACASLASLTEAVLTGGNDNVVVPVILWTCVKSFGL